MGLLGLLFGSNKSDYSSYYAQKASKYEEIRITFEDLQDALPEFSDLVTKCLSGPDDSSIEQLDELDNLVSDIIYWAYDLKDFTTANPGIIDMEFDDMIEFYEKKRDQIQDMYE